VSERAGKNESPLVFSRSFARAPLSERVEQAKLSETLEHAQTATTTEPAPEKKIRWSET